jgi:hypothetical protein
MAVFLAPMAAKAAKKGVEIACGQVLGMVSKKIKEQIQMFGDKICDRAFQEEMIAKVSQPMKNNKLFPSALRLEAEAKIKEILQQPDFKSACDMKDYIKMYDIVDAKLSEARIKIPGCGTGAVRSNNPKAPSTNSATPAPSTAPSTNSATPAPSTAPSTNSATPAPSTAPNTNSATPAPSTAPNTNSATPAPSTGGRRRKTNMRKRRGSRKSKKSRKNRK